MSDFTFTVPRPPALLVRDEIHEANKSQWASTMFDRLQEALRDFETSLNPDEEVGACLASFGTAVTIHVRRLGFHNPSLIFFYGESEHGDEVTLVQHVNQVNLLLVKLRPLSGREPRRIGFEKSP